MTQVYAVILAGGRGLRVGEDKPKQLLPLGTKSILQWSYDAFDLHDGVNRIVIVSPQEHLGAIEDMLKSCSGNRRTSLCTGGMTRQGSAYNGIKACDAEPDDIMLIHDAARPFVSRDVISRCIDGAREHGAAGTYVRSIDTIAEIRDDMVMSIPPRDNLYMTQTPQAFKYSVIMEAHEKARQKGMNSATDDVFLVLQAAGSIFRVEGDYNNIKITTPEDYRYAQFLVRDRIRETSEH